MKNRKQNDGVNVLSTLERRKRSQQLIRAMLENVTVGNHPTV